MVATDSRGRKSRHLFFSGVLALSIANITVKLLGLIFKIPIANILSDPSLGRGEGLGYFSSSYTVYTWLFMVATSGLPNGIAIVVSESRERGEGGACMRIFRSTLLLFSAVGCFLFLAMFFGAGGIAGLIRNPEARFAMASIAPTLFFVSVMSVYRGYFYGFREMLPSAISEVIEAVAKLLFGVLGATYAFQKGYGAPIVSAYAIFGVTMGVFCGTLYLAFAKRRYEKKGRLPMLSENALPKGKAGGTLRRVLSLSIPITVASSVMSLTGLIDVFTMMNRLQAIGYSAADASALYGTYTMLAVPLYNLPVILLSPVSSAMIPLLSENIAKGNRKGTKRIGESAIRLISLVVIPASIGMATFSYEILTLFYAPDAAAVAAPFLSLLSAATFLLGLLTISNAILQAHKMAGNTVISMSVGAVIKFLSSYFLVSVPRIGAYAVPLGTVLCYLTIVGLNFYFLARHLSIFPSFSFGFFRPLLASLLAVLFGKYFVYARLALLLPSTLATLLSIAVVMLLYGCMLLLFRSLLLDDLLLLPGGKKISQRLAFVTGSSRRK